MNGSRMKEKKFFTHITNRISLRRMESLLPSNFNDFFLFCFDKVRLLTSIRQLIHRLSTSLHLGIADVQEIPIHLELGILLNITPCPKNGASFS